MCILGSSESGSASLGWTRDCDVSPGFGVAGGARCNGVTDVTSVKMIHLAGFTPHTRQPSQETTVVE